MFRIERERVVVAVGSPIAGVGQNERIVGDEKSSLVPKMERRLRPRQIHRTVETKGLQSYD